jgi:hypothetical protein
MLRNLIILTGEEDEELLSVCLEIAKEAVLNKLYPYGAEGKEVPARYANLTVSIAQYVYDKIGASGQTVHLENGIHRHYESAYIPPSMLREITPFAEVL